MLVDLTVYITVCVGVFVCLGMHVRRQSSKIEERVKREVSVFSCVQTRRAGEVK